MKIVACNIQDENYDDIVKKYHIRAINRIYSPGIYMHGELQSKMGYDQIEILNVDDIKTFEAKYSNAILRIPDIEGIYDCEIIGCDEPCVAYIWKTDDSSKAFRSRGLICLKSDMEYIEDAKEKYNKKVMFL